jgi:hypothetical protein
MICFTSCIAETKSKSEDLKSGKIPEKELIAEDQIMQFIINDFKKEYKDLSLVEVDDEGWHELSFFGKLDPQSDIEQILSHIRIPNYTLVDEEENNPIKGDLNGDSKSDYLVKVTDEGDGGGGNLTLISYYLFTSNNGKYEFNGVYSTKELSGCANFGFFVAQKIQDQQVIGQSQCNEEKDKKLEQVKYTSILSLEEGELKLLSKKPLSE